MANYYDDSWLTTNRWGKWGKDDEVGAMNEMTDATKLAALSLIKKGKVYDLETERFKGMPIWGGHCGFDMMSYAFPPRGRRNMLESHLDSEFSWYAPGGMCDPAGADFFKMGLNTEIMVAPLHLGTHIDAFCHWTTGEDDHWYNGFTGDKYCTNFGPVRCDASKIPPIVTRGVLLDIAGYKGLDVLPDNYIITAEDAEGCAKWEGVELKPGDSVLLRTGPEVARLQHRRQRRLERQRLPLPGGRLRRHSGGRRPGFGRRLQRRRQLFLAEPPPARAPLPAYPERRAHPGVRSARRTCGRQGV